MRARRKRACTPSRMMGVFLVDGLVPHWPLNRCFLSVLATLHEENHSIMTLFRQLNISASLCNTATLNGLTAGAKRNHKADFFFFPPKFGPVKLKENGLFVPVG